MAVSLLPSPTTCGGYVGRCSTNRSGLLPGEMLPLSVKVVTSAQWIKRHEQVLFKRETLRTNMPGASRKDEDGVKEFELYLDDLSLEYESVWDTKPLWCQPWTIVVSGMTAIGGSWSLFHDSFITGSASLLIGVWWFSFLYAYPRAYAEMIAERRKRVENGSEDTFGRKRD